MYTILTILSDGRVIRSHSLWSYDRVWDVARGWAEVARLCGRTERYVIVEAE